MCNRYHPTRAEILQQQWEFDFSGGAEPWRPGLGPRGRGPFVRLKKDSAQPELVVGIWALIGDDYKKPINMGRMTNCARFEEITEKVTYAGPWRRGQRCVIPATRFDYPNWETGKNVWWTLRRADGMPWHLAGIWNTWTDPSTGEVFESYSMLTQNCDAHPLLRRFHKFDENAPPEKQDKRTVVPLEEADVRTWLAGSIDEAAALVGLLPESLYDAQPDSPLPRAKPDRPASNLEFGF